MDIPKKKTFTMLDWNVLPNQQNIQKAQDQQKLTSKSIPKSKKIIPIKKSKDSEEIDECDESIKNIDSLVQKTVKHFDRNTFKARPRQIECFDIIDQLLNLCALLPTSYGKTKVAIYACEKCRESGKQFVIVAPLKALVSEHASDTKFGEFYTVVQISGDFKENKKLFGDKRVDGYILTFEMFFQMLLDPNYRDLIVKIIGLVVFDEAHLVCDKSRGHRIEAIHYLLEYFHPTVKKILLSATVGNGKEFSEHFGCKSVIATASERPVPLVKEFHPHEKVFSAQQRFDLACRNVNLVINKYIHNEVFPHMLFFVLSREDVPKIANYINITYGTQKVHAGCHHAGMTKPERQLTEENYRKNSTEEGSINIVCCTTTLSMGLDMPTDVCVMLGMTFYEFLKSLEKLMDSNQAIQIMGRAGRGNGSLPKGYTYLFYPQDYDEKVKPMVNNPIQIVSQIPNHLDYILLSYLVSGIPETKLKDIYARTFITPLDWELYTNTLIWLKKSGFLTKEGKPTDFGTKTITFALEPKTALHCIQSKKVIEKLDHIDYPTFFALLLLNDEFCGNISVRKNSTFDQSALRNAVQFISDSKLQQIVEGNEYFEHNLCYFDQICKGFAMTYAFHLETKYKLEPISVSNNDLNVLRGSAQRIIKAFFTLVGKNWKFGNQMRLLNKSLQTTVPVFDEQMIRMIQIKGLSAKACISLQTIGINTLEDLAKLNDTLIPKFEVQIKKLVESEKSLKPYQKKYVSISQMRLRNWKITANEVIIDEKKELAEIYSTHTEVDAIDSSLITSNPINEIEEKKEKTNESEELDDESEEEIQRIEGSQP